MHSEEKNWYLYKEMKTTRAAMMSFYLANGHKVATDRVVYKFHTNFMLMLFCTFSLYHSSGKGDQGGRGTIREMVPGSSVPGTGREDPALPPSIPGISH